MWKCLEGDGYLKPSSCLSVLPAAAAWRNKTLTVRVGARNHIRQASTVNMTGLHRLGSFMWQPCLPVLHSSQGWRPSSPPHSSRHGRSPLFPPSSRSQTWEIPKSCLCLPCPAIGCRHCYLPIRTNWGEVPRSYVQIPRQFHMNSSGGT